MKDGHLATLSVPDHRIVAKGTLRSLIRAADVTVQEFLATRQPCFPHNPATFGV